MVVINQAQLRRAVPEVYRGEIDSFVASFNQWAIHFGITTPKRVTHYLAQVFTEAACLKSTEENLNYSAGRLLQVFPKYFNTSNVEAYAFKPEKIGNRVYANRMGNGNEASGDGYKYHGRGYIMLTGKEQYLKFNRFDLCMKDVVSHPEEVAKFPLNQIASMWFWQTHKLNEIADLDDGGKMGEDIVTRITKIVNGGINGLSSRKLYYRRFKKEFGI